MKKLIQVGKCIHCGDPIYRFQVEAHRGCVKEYEFNPDYLNFDKGVEAGKVIERDRIGRLLSMPPRESIYCGWCSLLEAGTSAAHDSCRLYGSRLEDDRNGHKRCFNCREQWDNEVESDIEL